MRIKMLFKYQNVFIMCLSYIFKILVLLESLVRVNGLHHAFYINLLYCSLYYFTNSSKAAL